MVELKKYNWIFPFVGSLIIIFAFLTPAAINLDNTNKQIWMCGLSTNNSNNSMSIIDDGNVFIGSIVCSIFIIFISIVTVKSSNKVRKGGIYMETVEKAWFVESVLIIVLEIIWMLLLNLLITKTIVSVSSNKEGLVLTAETFRFWEYHVPGFGVIGIFLGASLIMVGAILKKKLRKKRVAII